MGTRWNLWSNSKRLQTKWGFGGLKCLRTENWLVKKPLGLKVSGTKSRRDWQPFGVANRQKKCWKTKTDEAELVLEIYFFPPALVPQAFSHAFCLICFPSAFCIKIKISVETNFSCETKWNLEQIRKVVQKNLMCFYNRKSTFMLMYIRSKDMPEKQKKYFFIKWTGRFQQNAANKLIFHVTL